MKRLNIHTLENLTSLLQIGLHFYFLTILALVWDPSSFFRMYGNMRCQSASWFKTGKCHLFRRICANMYCNMFGMYIQWSFTVVTAQLFDAFISEASHIITKMWIIFSNVKRFNLSPLCSKIFVYVIEIAKADSRQKIWNE